MNMEIGSMFKNKKILLVDDSSFMREILKRILEPEGFTIIAEADNGDDGYAMYMEHDPDLVLTDVVMDGMDGIGMIRKICTSDANARIVVCSAMGQRPYVNEAIAGGARDFIVKPFIGDRVLDAVCRNVR